jgi:hypothetical protein
VPGSQIADASNTLQQVQQRHRLHPGGTATREVWRAAPIKLLASDQDVCTPRESNRPLQD